jgi:hypothetical protein
MYACHAHGIYRATSQRRDLAVAFSCAKQASGGISRK